MAGRPRQDAMAVLQQAEKLVEGMPQSASARQALRRTKAVSLALAGLTYAQIGEQLGISIDAARNMVRRALAEGRHSDADQMRDLENARLDRAQAAIWSRVLEGDIHAIDRFLKITERRARLNGLDAPARLHMSVNIRQEMQAALTELENVLEGEVVSVTDETSSDTDIVELEQAIATGHDYTEDTEDTDDIDVEGGKGR